MMDSLYNHRAKIGAPDGKPIVFKWHFPRGTFERRMSAYELAEFVLPHMPSISPLLSHHPRIKAEWDAMLAMLITQPRLVIDQVASWIKPVLRTQEADIIELCLFADKIDEAPRAYFV